MSRPPDEAKGIEEKRALKRAANDRKRARAKALWEEGGMTRNAMRAILHVDAKTLQRWADEGGWKGGPSKAAGGAP